MLNIVQRIPELIYLLFKNDGFKHWFPALYHGGWLSHLEDRYQLLCQAYFCSYRR